MGDNTPNVTNRDTASNASVYDTDTSLAASSGTVSQSDASSLPIDTPHGLKADLEYLKDFYVQAPKTDPLALISYLKILPQLLDRPGSSQFVELTAPLRKGEFLSEFFVPGDNHRMFAKIALKDGYLEGEMNFYPPVIQKNFKGTVDLPSNSLLGKAALALDVDVHTIKIVTQADKNDPTKKSTRFIALVSHRMLSMPNPILNPNGFYMEVDVTELITRRYLGEQMTRIDFPASQLVEKAMAHIQKHPFADMMMFDPSGVNFNIKASSDGTMPEYTGPYQFCTAGANLACSSLQFHWDILAIGDTLTLQDIDTQAFVFKNPKTNGFIVELPTASVGQVVESLYNSPYGVCIPSEKSATLTNSRLEKVVLELEPKDPNNLLAGLYLKKGKGVLLSSEFNAMDDIKMGSLGSGVTFELTGDIDNHISARINAPGFILDKADLLVQGGTSIQIDDAVTLGLEALVDFKDGVLSYAASMESHLKAAAFSTVIENVANLRGGIADFMCKKIELKSDNILQSHQISAQQCQGSMSGTAKLFSPLPLDATFVTNFSGMSSNVTVALPTQPGKLPDVTINEVKLPDFDFTLNVGYKKYKARMRTEDGPAKNLNGSVIDRGVTLTTNAQGVIKAQISLVDKISIEGPQGKLTNKGNLVGTAELVNIAAPGEIPNLRPKVGSLRFETNRATLINALGQTVQIKDAITIQDDASGKIIITDANSPRILGLPIAPKLFTTIDIVPQGSIKQTVNGIRYYDLPEGLGVSFTAKLSDKHIKGAITTTGSASITGLKTGDIQANYDISTPLNGQKITLPNGWVELVGGKASVKGSEKNAVATVRPPDLKIHFTENVAGFGELVFEGTLKNDASFATHVDLKSKKGALHQSGNRPALSGEVTITATTALGAPKLVLGKVKLTSDYNLSGDFDTKQLKFSLDVPETGLSGELLEDINTPLLSLAKGTKLNLPITGFRGDIAVDLNKAAITSDWKISNIDPAVVTIPRFKVLDIELEDVAVTMSQLANGLTLRASYDSKNGPVLEALPGADGQLPPLDFTLNVKATNPHATEQNKLTKDVSISLTSQSKASSISGHQDHQTGEYVFTVGGMSLVSLLKGITPISQVNELALKDIATNVDLPGVEVRLNPVTKKLRIVANPPVPQGVTTPPANLKNWLAWSQDDWKNYRDQMGATRHLAVLSAGAAELPGNDLIPPGRGLIYVDMKPIDRTFDLNDPALVDKILTAVVGSKDENGVRQNDGSLMFAREWPNPPKDQNYPESMVYSEGQDALFTIKDDAELPELVRNAFGEGEAVDRFLANDRIDIADLPEVPFLKDNFAPEAPRGLVDAYFRQKSPDKNFSNWTYRFFYTLSALRDNKDRLTQPLSGDGKPYWSKNNVFATKPVDFNDAKYRGAMAKDEGENGTDVSHLRYAPAKVFDLVKDLQNHARLELMEIRSVKKEDDGSFSGVVKINPDHFDPVRPPTAAQERGYNFHVTTAENSYGPVSAFSYGLKDGADSDFTAFSARYLVVSALNGTSYLIQDHAFDAETKDADFFEGLDPDLSKEGDPSRNFISLNNPAKTAFTDVTMVNNQNIRTAEPNRNPREVMPTIMSRAISRLNRSLYRNQAIDFRDTALDVKTLSHVADDPLQTSTPPEFLSYEKGAKPGEGKILIKAPKEYASNAKKLLMDNLGIDAAAADKLVADGEIKASYIAELPVYKDLFDAETVDSFAELVIGPNSGVSPQFKARSERFLIQLNDIKTNYAKWDDSDDKDGTRQMQARDFSDASRFHEWSKNNPSSDRKDSTDSVLYAIFPGDQVKRDDYLQVAINAQYFKESTAEGKTGFQASENVSCEPVEAGFTCTNTSLDVDAKVLHYRIKAPDPATMKDHPERFHVGNIGIASWTAQARSDKPGQGFFENEGYWAIVPLKGDRVLIQRVGLLNTVVPNGDKKLAKTAFQRVTYFDRWIFKKAAELAGKSGLKAPNFEFKGESGLLSTK